MAPADLPAYEVLMPLAPWEEPGVLAAALASLEAQTCPPDRLVVSCDGPPPPELREGLKQIRLPLTLVIGPGGEGVGPVLTRGLGSCRRQLVVRADADDLSRAHRCAVQVAWMRRHPEVVALGSVIDEFVDGPPQHAELPIGALIASLRVVSQRVVPIGSEPIRRWAMSRNPLNHPSVVLRRKQVLAVGSYRAKPGFEDYDLWLRLLAAYGPTALANIPDALVLARVGGGHLARRHGRGYAVAEARFLLTCGRDGTLPWWHVGRALVVRLPLRLLPRGLLAWVMARVTRRVSVGN
jgi:hypothetical protein